MFVLNKIFFWQGRLLNRCKIFIFYKPYATFIDDEEFLVLSDLFEWKNLCFPYEDHSTFNLNEMTEFECLSEFRYGKRDIPMR